MLFLSFVFNTKERNKEKSSTAEDCSAHNDFLVDFANLLRRFRHTRARALSKGLLRRFSCSATAASTVAANDASENLAKLQTSPGAGNAKYTA
jgi:hypothetical protein